MIYNVALSFARRVYNFSHPQFHADNKIKIRTILAKNNFSPPTIAKIISSVFSDQRPTTGNTAHIAPSYAALSYVPGLSEPLTKQLKYFLPHVNLAHRPENKNCQFFHKQKDKILPADHSNVVYQVNCNSCDTVYIGETTRKLSHRISQHKTSTLPHNIPKESTALVKHISDTGHLFDFEHPKILEHQENRSKLKICEVNQIIMQQEKTCNYKTDSNRIAPTYFNLLRLHANKPDHLALIPPRTPTSHPSPTQTTL